MNRKIKDLPGLIAALKPNLRDYLESAGTEFTSNGEKFQCPNRENHSNNDATPSCNFADDKGEVWYCYACLEKGDIFQAAALLEGKPVNGTEWISENVEYLAKRFGVNYEYIELSEQEQIQFKAYEALQFTADASHVGFLKSDVARAYVRERGWADETTEEFALGYCDYDKLIQALYKRGYTHDILVRAGLVHKQLLHKRLLFPIRDARGHVTGFASRTIDKGASNHSKYINAQTTPIYKKSESLYNIDKIRDMESVWIVEGYADVLSLCQRGIKNVVGLGGVYFTEDHIQVLLKRGVKSLILCLDSDVEGQRAEERILSQITHRHGISVWIKKKDECNDPDSCLKEHDYLLTADSISSFDYYLERYRNSNDRADREKAVKSILLERSRIDRDRMCKRMAKELDVRIETIWAEVDYLVDREGSMSLVNLTDLVKERQVFEKQLSDFERRSWNRDELLGLATEYQMFTEKMDGIQSGNFYIVAGEEGVGKSAFLRSLMMGLLKKNKDKVFVLYFSIDDSTPKVIARLLASETRLEINAMENPKWRIQNNSVMSKEQRDECLARRERALEQLRSLTSCFLIKDESTVHSVGDMEKSIRTVKELAGERQLIVFIDSLHRMKTPKKFHESSREQAMEISDVIKKWCNVFDIAILATAELRKLNNGANTNRRPTLDDVKEASDFKYDSDVMMLLYNDIKANARCPSQAKLKWEMGHPGSGDWYPIVEVFVGKNKTSGFDLKSIYYRFVPQSADMIECNEVEQGKYRAAALNI